MKLTSYTLLSALLLSQLQATPVTYIETFFDKGQIKAQTYYKENTRTKNNPGIKHGLEKVYYQSGQLAYEVNYVDGIRDGKLTWLDRDGNILSTMFYKMGKIHGEDKTYFVNKEVKHIVNYIDDKKEGIQKEFYDNGTLAQEVNYVDNKKEGIQKEYTVDAKLFSEVTYKNNYKEGVQKWYDKKGNVTKEEVYKMDRPIKVMKKIQKDNNNVFIEELKGLNFSPNRPQK